MPFPADKLGLRLTPCAWDMSARAVLAYAAGLGASEAAFLDDAQGPGLRALPFQCVSLEWPVVVSLRAALRDSLSEAEARRGVHAVQDSTFHRPIRPGDRLETAGELVGVRAARAGVAILCRLITRDRTTGEPVTTTWTSSIYRDVVLSGEACALAEPPALSADQAEPPGHAAEAVTIQIAREAPHVYSECARIWNPIHTERAMALAAGLPDIILHGTATWALAGLTILRRYAECDVAALKRLTGRFSGMVIPGETITVRHEPGPSGVVRFEVRKADGGVAISQGVAWL